MLRSLSPMYLESSSGPRISITLNPLSFAIERAIRVFPTPDGPVINRPEGRPTPNFSRKPTFLSGQRMLSTRNSTSLEYPPTLLQPASFRFTSKRLPAEGRIPLKASSKSPASTTIASRKSSDSCWSVSSKPGRERLRAAYAAS